MRFSPSNGNEKSSSRKVMMLIWRIRFANQSHVSFHDDEKQKKMQFQEMHIFMSSSGFRFIPQRDQILFLMS